MVLSFFMILQLGKVLAYLLRIISAAITPGTQAQSVSRVTMVIEPQPLSSTARGGKIIQSNTLRQDMVIIIF